jgi:hypothetical protein
MDWNTKVLFVWVSASNNKTEFTLWDNVIKRESTSLYIYDEYTLPEFPIETPTHLDGSYDIYFNWEHMPLVGFNYKVIR